MAPRARARSFSKQRIVGAYTARGRNSTPIKTQMAVINWENVLVPLDWMIVHLGLGTSTTTFNQTAFYSRSRSLPELPRRFAAIEDSIMELLAETARSVNGPVFIVSEYPTAYVEFVCYVFYPRLTAALCSATTGIYVIGTPATQLTTLEVNQWKVNLLRTVILERVFAGLSVGDAAILLKRSSSGRLGVIALCASSTDVAATSTIYSVAPHAIVKCARVKTGEGSCATHPLGSPLGLEDFHTQLQTLTQFVRHSVAANQPIKIAL